jgi:hypothetical protein
MFFLMIFSGIEINSVYSQTQSRAAILLRGNEWVTGIPGFGENAFPAIFGAYRLDEQGREPGYSSVEEAAFSVWVCHEALFFDDNWQFLRDIGGYPVHKYLKNDNLSLVVSFESSTGRPWDAVFIFARGIQDNSWLNQFIEAWIYRFLHFLSSAEMDEQLSLPAVVSY